MNIWIKILLLFGRIKRLTLVSKAKTAFSRIGIVVQIPIISWVIQWLFVLTPLSLYCRFSLKLSPINETTCFHIAMHCVGWTLRHVCGLVEARTLWWWSENLAVKEWHGQCHGCCCSVVWWYFQHLFYYVECIFTYTWKILSQRPSNIPIKMNVSLLSKLVAISPLFSAWRAKYLQYFVNLIKFTRSWKHWVLKVQLTHYATGSKYIRHKIIVMRPKYTLRCSIPPGWNIWSMWATLDSKVLACTKVNYLCNQGVLIDHYIIWFEISMHYAKIIM